MNMPEIKGYCPGALKPMMSGDGLVVRVRPFCGKLSPEQMVGISDLSEEYGNGYLDVSRRANLQIRGVKTEDHAKILSGLSGLNLLDRSIEVETRRNVIVQPFWKSGDVTENIAIELNKRLARDDAPALPAKFGFAVDSGTYPVLREDPADIRIESVEGDRIICYAESMAKGKIVSPSMAAKTALSMAKWFVDSGGVYNGRGRMQAHLQKVTLPQEYQHHDIMAAATLENKPGMTPGGAMVGLPYGQLEAKTLRDISPCGAIRLTPWRMLLIEDMTYMPKLKGLVTDEDDPLLRIIACTGAPNCPQAVGSTRTLLPSIIDYLPRDKTLHISGCTKSCASSAASDITLVASSADSFDIIYNDNACAVPAKTEITMKAIRQNPTLLLETI